MNTLAARPQDELDDPSDEQLPGRPRHKLVNRITAPLLVLLVTAGGFLAGIEVQTGHDGGTATTGAAGGLPREPGASRQLVSLRAQVPVALRQPGRVQPAAPAPAAPRGSVALPARASEVRRAPAAGLRARSARSPARRSTSRRPPAPRSRLISPPPRA